MVADRVAFGRRLFQPLGQDVDRLFGSAADWVNDGRGGISDRLWLAGKMDRREIDKILRHGLATGADPLTVARDLEDYLLPAGRPVRNPETGRIVKWKKDATGKLLRDTRGRLIPANAKGVLTRTPRSGKGSYAARRLARTEVSRAFNQGVLQAAALNPFVEGAKWNKSSSHKEEDICDQHAQNHSAGMGPGEYRIDEFPQMPAHPHCLCYATKVVTQDVDGVVAQLGREVAGDPVGAVAELEQRAISLGVEHVDYQGEEEIGRVVNRALEQLQAAGKPVPARIRVTQEPWEDIDMEESVFAVFDIDSREIIIDATQEAAWGDDRLIKQMGDDGFMFAENREDVVIHEAGHAAHFAHAPHLFTDVPLTWSSPIDRQTARIVSRYAAESPYEFVAEMYSARVNNVYFGREAEDLYFRLGGPP